MVWDYFPSLEGPKKMIWNTDRDPETTAETRKIIEVFMAKLRG
jgi:hypothetical protein